MIKLSLLTMPQTLLAFPSIGVTQIASSLNKVFKTDIKVDIFYPCLDFASYIGLDNYIDLQASGLNEFLFRKEAFPEAEEWPQRIEDLKQQEEYCNISSTAFKLFLDIRKNIKNYLDFIIDKYHLLEYNIIGLSSAFSQNIPSFSLARRIKARKSSCIVVMGGANCSFPMGKAIIDHIECIDFVFAGPGIISFTQFIKTIINKDDQGIHQINGVFSKKNEVRGFDSKITKSKQGKRAFVVAPVGDYHDINQCIDLDYDSFFADFHKFCQETGYPHKPALLFETSRGCWKRDKLPCTFCGLNDLSVCFESMNPDLAISYIQKLIDRYGDQCSVYSCVDSIIDKQYFEKVIPFLKVPAHLSIMYETSANISREEMSICAKQGVALLQPGIESLRLADLKLMQKGTTPFINLQFLKNSIEVGNYPIWNYLFGVPGNEDNKSYQDLAEVLPSLRHLPPPSGFFPISFVRFSHYTQNQKEYDLELIPGSISFHLYPLEESVVRQIGVYFIDKNANAEYREIAEKYVPEINLEIIEWMSVFRNAKEIPKLYYVDENHVFDSRFDLDTPVIHNLSNLEKEMLLYLEQPMTFNQIKLRMCYTSSVELTKAFDHLYQKKLLYYDSDKYLSLICKQCCWTKAGFNQLIELVGITTTAIF